MKKLWARHEHIASPSAGRDAGELGFEPVYLASDVEAKLREIRNVAKGEWLTAQQDLLRLIDEVLA